MKGEIQMKFLTTLHCSVKMKELITWQQSRCWAQVTPWSSQHLFILSDHLKILHRSVHNQAAERSQDTVTSCNQDENQAHNTKASAVLPHQAADEHNTPESRQQVAEVEGNRQRRSPEQTTAGGPESRCVSETRQILPHLGTDGGCSRCYEWN